MGIPLYEKDVHTMMGKIAQQLKMPGAAAAKKKKAPMDEDSEIDNLYGDEGTVDEGSSDDADVSLADATVDQLQKALDKAKQKEADEMESDEEEADEGDQGEEDEEDVLA